MWWDVTLRAGEAYDQVTEDALRGAKAVVVLWSKKSVASRWVRAEATLADRNRTLVPAMIEPCDRPIMFELTQTADLSQWAGETADRAWHGFVTDVRRFVGANSSSAPQPPADVHAPAVAAPSQRKDQRPSLAILPFTNRSGERADDIFADGMVEDLIGALSLSGGVKVIAQSATIVYRKNVSDLRTIGRELGVRYLLEGNVRRVSTTLRVTAQLVEAETAEILWLQRFDRPLSELADLQEDLVMEVASNLGVEVERAEMENALRKPGDLTAWETVMRVLSSLGRLSPEHLRNAVFDGRRAVAVAPDYAPAHAVLAGTLANLYMSEGCTNEEHAREARVIAQKALALDGSDPLALTSVGLAMLFTGSAREALTYTQRAVDLNPNMALCRVNLSLTCLRFMRPTDAMNHAEAALILAPRGYMSYLSVGYKSLAYYLMGQYEEAIQAVDQALILYPYMFSLKDKALYCEKLGRHEDARDAVRRLRIAAPGLTLEGVERSNVLVFSPETASDMNSTFRRVWMDTTL